MKRKKLMTFLFSLILMMSTFALILPTITTGQTPSTFPSYSSFDFKEVPVVPLGSESPSPSPNFSPSASPSGIPSDVIGITPEPTVKPKPISRITPPPTDMAPVVDSSGFYLDPEVSWYGPGFYGKRTACGLAYTKTILGVAHRSLPCGTLVDFKYNGTIVTVPVIDRGPYVAGRQWDLSGGLCIYLGHCFTGPIYYRIH